MLLPPFSASDIEQEVTAYFQSSEVANFYGLFYLEVILTEEPHTPNAQLWLRPPASAHMRACRERERNREGSELVPSCWYNFNYRAKQMGYRRHHIVTLQPG